MANLVLIMHPLVRFRTSHGWSPGIFHRFFRLFLHEKRWLKMVEEQPRVTRGGQLLFCRSGGRVAVAGDRCCGHCQNLDMLLKFLSFFFCLWMFKVYFEMLTKCLKIVSRICFKGFRFFSCVFLTGSVSMMFSTPSWQDSSDAEASQNTRRPRRLSYARACNFGGFW